MTSVSTNSERPNGFVFAAEQGGFHIYDVGFQPPNVDAARPMVFTTTLLLLAIVVCLNVFAIGLRHRLRRAYAASAV